MALRSQLQTVLRVRRLEFERATVGLAGARRSMAEATHVRVAWSDRLNAGVGELEARLRHGLPAAQLRTATTGMGLLAAREREATGMVGRAREAVQRARQELMRTRIGVRALELLLEREALQQRRERERRDQLDLDEVAARVAGARASS